MPQRSHKQHVIISVNPFAGAGSQTSEACDLRSLLRSSGFEVSISECLQQTCDQAIQLHAECKLRAVVGVGGDGTMAELLNRTPPGLPLAMLPRGTENLLAKFLGMKRASVEKMADVIISGQQLQLDAGRISAIAPPGGPNQDQPPGTRETHISRLFLLMAGFGFDAEVVRRLHAARSGHIHHLSYLKPICESLRNYKYPEMRVSVLSADGQVTRSLKAKWLFLFNCPAYGGGLRIVPQAECADGLLDYCTFGRGSAWMAMKYLTMVLTGMHQGRKDVEVGKAASIRVDADDEVPIQVDGDPLGFAPAEIECCPGRMTILAPREFRLRAATRQSLLPL